MSECPGMEQKLDWTIKADCIAGIEMQIGLYLLRSVSSIELCKKLD